ncbi:MAG: glycosyltransferase [Candidatus Eisenbacteria bacterium]|nr:glycosyltransferase [Candidatus Eisenbacteria bacterium]
MVLPDMICLSPNHWTGLSTSKKHLMQIFSEDGRVLFCEPPIDLLSVLGRRRRWVKLAGLRQAKEGLWVLPAVSMSTHGTTKWRRRFHARRLDTVRRSVEQLALTRPVVWAFAPEHIEYAGKLGESFLIYYVTDEPTSLARDREETRAADRSLVERADLVLGLSANLAEARRVPGKTRRLRSAADRRHYAMVLAGNEEADVDSFIRALESPGPVPSELRSVGCPLVLFGGAAYDWFDAGLLLELSRARPQWTFALVGPRGRELRTMAFPPNVISIGRKSYEDFPRYVAQADVTFMPVRPGETYDNCDPIILYEYLLCGKPVVATPFPSAVEHGELVRTAADAMGFAREIEAGLEEARDPAWVRKRVEYGFANTWEERAAESLRFISELTEDVEPASREGGRV